MKLVIDPARSSVRLRTFAEGLFSRLAHDLELSCRDVSGAAERAGDDQGSATVVVPISKIEVAGTLKGGRLDPNGLSGSDRVDCLEKMRRDVFHTDGGDVRVEASLVSPSQARVTIVPPKGRTVTRAVAVKVTPDGDTVRAAGNFMISLNEIGSDPVKGPMNAFRVKDGVEILFEVTFVAQ